jgi:hypothetical protein
MSWTHNSQCAYANRHFIRQDLSYPRPSHWGGDCSRGRRRRRGHWPCGCCGPQGIRRRAMAEDDCLRKNFRLSSVLLFYCHLSKVMLIDSWKFSFAGEIPDSFAVCWLDRQAQRWYRCIGDVGQWETIWASCQNRSADGFPANAVLCWWAIYLLTVTSSASQES